MVSDYQIVGYQPSMKREIAELGKHIWSSDAALNLSYFAWKYERNPYQPEPLIFVALMEGRVVGMRGMFGICWEFGSPARPFPALYADDFAIDPEHRNRSLVTRIMKAAVMEAERRGHRYLFNLSAGNVTRIASLATGWKSAGSMRLRSRWPEPPERVRPEAGLDAGPPTPGANILVEQAARAGEMAGLVAGVPHDGRIRHVRDETYFRWRFLNPLHRYRFIYWWQEQLMGYLVLQESISDLVGRGARFNIVEWEATSAPIRAALLRTAIDVSASATLTVWTATLSDESSGLLRDAGFQPSTRVGVNQIDHWLLIRPVRDAVPEAEWRLGASPLLDLASWDLRMTDSMHG